MRTSRIACNTGGNASSWKTWGEEHYTVKQGGMQVHWLRRGSTSTNVALAKVMESEATHISTEAIQSNCIEGKLTEGNGITEEILGALSTDQTEELANKLLNTRCKNLQFDERLRKAAAQHLNRFRPNACLTRMRKIVGYLWLMTKEKNKFGSFQTAFVKESHCAWKVHLAS